MKEKDNWMNLMTGQQVRIQSASANLVLCKQWSRAMDATNVDHTGRTFVMAKEGASRNKRTPRRSPLSHFIPLFVSFIYETLTVQVRCASGRTSPSDKVLEQLSSIEFLVLR